MMRAARLGFALGWSRLPPRRVAVLALLGALASSGVALAVRSSSPLAAPNVVASLVFGLVLPLTAYGAVSTGSGSTDLSSATWPAARRGFSRRPVAMGLALAAFVATLAVVFPVLLVGFGVAYRATPGFSKDCVTSGGLVALGAAAYVSAFSLASTAMRRGRARSLLLCLDFFVGAFGSAFSLPFPRAHLRSLLGGEAVAMLSQRQSSGALLTLTLVAFVMALVRLRR